MDRRSVLSMVIALGVGIVATACSGPEAGTIYFSEAGFTEAEDEEEEDEPRTKTKSAPSTGQSASALFEKEVFPTLNTSCGACHQEGNTLEAPVFIGKDAAATYSMFKANDYHLPNSELVTKGAHSGPALTEEQKAAVDKWVAAEAKK